MPRRDIKKFLKETKSNPPPVIFLTSKSGTGKSYISNKLKDLGYVILELDVIVRKLGKKHNLGKGPHYNDAFLTIYKGKASEKVKKDFIKRIRNFIKKHKKVVVEGAISSPPLIKEVFDGLDHEIYFLYPSSTQRYVDRLIMRYDTDIKKGTRTLPFWEEIGEPFKTRKELKSFMKKQAIEMIKSTKKRAKTFKDGKLKMKYIYV